MGEPILAAQDTWFSQGGTTVTRASITEIHIKDTYTPSGTVTASWDASAAKDGSVTVYVEGTKLTIAGNGYGKIYANPNSTFAFSSSGSDYFSAVTTFNGGNLLDTIKVTNMQQMFYMAKSLKTLDVSNWDTSNVTNMMATFYEATALETVNVTNWNTSKVETMYLMFGSGSSMSLHTLDVSNWDTGKVNAMLGMFQNCANLTSLNVSNWNVGEVTSFQNTFKGCSKLSTLDVSNWNTGKVTSFQSTFNSCYELEELDVSNWNTGNVTNMSYMFAANTNNAGGMKIKSLDVGNWNTNKVTTMKQMFYGCGQLTELNLSGWNTSNVTNMQLMFAYCPNLTTIYVSNAWSIVKATSSGNVFTGCTSLIGGAGTVFDSSYLNITYAKIDGGAENPGYFTNYLAHILAAQDTWFSQGGTTVTRASITEIEIRDTYTPSGAVTSSWDASAAKDGSVMAYVEGTKLIIAGNGYGKVYANPDSTAAFSSSGSDYFSAMTTFTGGTLLDTSKVTTMKDMFRNAVKLTIVDVSNWDTSNVTSMYRMFAASSGTMALKSLDVSKWDTSNVLEMPGAFQNCGNLTSLDISNWDTGKVNNMQAMFYGCSGLSFLDVSKWNTSSCTNMRGMFQRSTGLTYLDVSKWNTSKVTNFSSMFSGNSHAGDMKLMDLDVSEWDTSSATLMNHMFYGCGQLTKLDLSKWDVSKVTDMTHMFCDCFKMATYNFSGWNTASLTSVDGMFNDNRALVTLDVSDFNTGKITDFDQIFEFCANLKTINGLDKWDTSSGEWFMQTFKDCPSLIELNLSSWDTSAGRGFSQMFENCSSLETIYSSAKWNLNTDILGTGTNSDGVGSNDRVFSGCTKLIGGAGTAYVNNHVDYTTAPRDISYAHIDGGTQNPGYLTNIDDPTQLLIQTGTMHKLGLSVRGVTGDTAKHTPSEMVNALKDTRADINDQSNIIAQIATALENKVSPAFVKVSLDSGVLFIE